MYRSLFCILFIFIIPNFSFAQLDFKHTDGPDGGAYSYLFANEDFMFIPSGGYFFRSDNGAESWEKIEEEVSSRMDIYENNLVCLYYSDQDQWQVKISTDNGLTWLAKDIDQRFNSNTGIAMSSYGIYLSSPNEDLFLRSTDLGETWDTLEPPYPYAYDLWEFENRIFAGSSSSLWMSDNTGENWTNINPYLQSGDYIRDIIVSNEHIIVAGEEYLYHSHDNGNTWDFHFFEFQNLGANLAIVEDKLYFGFRDMYVSEDFGITYEKLLEASEFPYVLNLLGWKNKLFNNSIYKGVFGWSEDEQTFIEKNNGFSQSLVNELDTGIDKIWAATNNGVFYYDVNSEEWSEKMDIPLEPLSEFNFLDSNEEGWIITTSTYNHFFLSKDEGNTWEKITPMLPDTYFFFIDELKLIGNNIVIASDYFLYISQDEGQSWNIINVDSFGNNKIIEFKDRHYIAGYNKLFTSINDGVDWEEVPSTLEVSYIDIYSSQEYIYAIVEDVNNPSNQLYYSSDGIDWKPTGDGLPVIDWFFLGYDKIFFFQDADKHYVFWKYDGIFVSSDGLQTWELVLPDITGEIVLYKDELFYGTKGVYKSEILNPFIDSTTTSVISIKEKQQINIFPNPSNDKINISLKDNKTKNGIISIFDSKGQLVQQKNVNSISQLEISIEHLLVGVYVVKWTSEEGFYIGKFIVQE